MVKVVSWIVISTLAIGTLGWLLFTDGSFKAWLVLELLVLCVAVLVNREPIQMAMDKPKRKK